MKLAKHWPHLNSVSNSSRKRRMPLSQTSYGMERHNFSWLASVPCTSLPRHRHCEGLRSSSRVRQLSRSLMSGRRGKKVCGGHWQWQRVHLCRRSCRSLLEPAQQSIGLICPISKPTITPTIGNQRQPTSPHATRKFQMLFSCSAQVNDHATKLNCHMNSHQ